MGYCVRIIYRINLKIKGAYFMSKYQLIKEPDPNNKFDLTTVNISLEAESAADLAKAFYDFMLACGFSETTAIEYLNIE